MSYFTFQSMMGQLHKSSDCRVLYFEIEFSSVTQDALIEAGRAYYSGIESFFDDQFVSKWIVQSGDGSLIERILRRRRNVQWKKQSGS